MKPLYTDTRSIFVYDPMASGDVIANPEPATMLLFGSGLLGLGGLRKRFRKKIINSFIHKKQG